MKKVLKNFLFCGASLLLAFGALGVASVSSDRVSADDQFMTSEVTTPTWTYTMDTIKLKDNADGNGYRWPWGGGAKRVHFGLAGNPLAELTHSSNNVNYYGFQNYSGACMYYYKADGTKLADENWKSFDSRLLNWTDHLSVMLDKSFTDIMVDGDYFTINCTVYFYRHSGAQGDSNPGADYSASIKFDNIKVVKVGNTWNLGEPDVEKTYDPVNFSNKVNDEWILNAYGTIPGVNLGDYADLTGGEYVAADNYVTYTRNGVDQKFSTTVSIDKQWGHTFFYIHKDKTGLASDIVPEYGDTMTVSGLWKAKNSTKYIKFSSPFTLTCAGRNWVVKNFSDYKFKALNPVDIGQGTATAGQIYISYNNDAGLAYNASAWDHWYYSQYRIATYTPAEGTEFKFGVSVCATAENTLCLSLESWAVKSVTPDTCNPKANIKAVKGDKVNVNGFIYYGTSIIQFRNITWEFNGTNWVVYNDGANYAQGAFDSEATNKGVVRVLGVSGYEADKVTSFGMDVTIGTKKITYTQADLTIYDKIKAAHGTGEAQEYTAVALGGRGIFGIEIHNIPTGEYTMKVQTYVVETSLAKTFTSVEKTYTVTVGADSTVVALA